LEFRKPDEAVEEQSVLLRRERVLQLRGVAGGVGRKRYHPSLGKQNDAQETADESDGERRQGTIDQDEVDREANGEFGSYEDCSQESGAEGFRIGRGLAEA
jgi:hypothetical protein